MLVTFVSLAMMLLGTIFDRSARFGYDVFISPMIYAFCGVIPGIFMYSQHELSVKQVIFRKIAQLLTIEAEVLLIAVTSSTVSAKRPLVLITLAAAVLIIFIAVNITELLFDMNTAEQLNSGLDRLRQNEE